MFPNDPVGCGRQEHFELCASALRLAALVDRAEGGAVPLDVAMALADVIRLAKDCAAA